MNYKQLEEYLLSKKDVKKTFPFDHVTEVYKVGGKMFALIPDKGNDLRINLKCDPDEAEALRMMFEAITPGYHMNKRHWNTVILDGSVPEEVVIDMIENSYELVFNSLTKKLQKEILEKIDEK